MAAKGAGMGNSPCCTDLAQHEAVVLAILGHPLHVAPLGPSPTFPAPPRPAPSRSGIAPVEVPTGRVPGPDSEVVRGLWFLTLFCLRRGRVRLPRRRFGHVLVYASPKQSPHLGRRLCFYSLNVICVPPAGLVVKGEGCPLSFLFRSGLVAPIKFGSSS